ncbi:UDP diphosphate synthase [candidate division MSBL1 archaeon SCGC-AAA833K04]|uniref:Tritrans,polycis-undecaprenyl-diphosphate synthase (geranylgeranyl-diphosphate specific) n=1 Tax=candidate division MSBL1 archaeon SCGC-AAA833K04 TaxID=1698258 RepID=A0A133VRU6_9EURY|nr:UDP diphosphate synthase [candidate division MSBL1 archaeon SCGC-AAA833K04]
MDLQRIPVERLPGIRELRKLARDYYEKRLLAKVKNNGNLPQHVAVILDGNRRYAEEVGIPKKDGHILGAEKLEEVLEWCQELGIRHMTVYAFSKENFNRSSQEVSELMKLFKQKFMEVAKYDRVHGKKIRIRAIGDLKSLPEEVRSAIREAEESTKDYDDYSLNIAVGYGGRAELAKAVQKICERVKDGDIEPREVNENIIGDHLYTAGLPDPDLIIRTSGEERLSGFLLWQAAYSELYFCEANWPEFDKVNFLRAISTYQSRERRFGK